MLLQQKLAEPKTSVRSQIPKEGLQKFNESIQALDESRLANHAPQVIAEELNNFVLSHPLRQ